MRRVGHCSFSASPSEISGPKCVSRRKIAFSQTHPSTGASLIRSIGWKALLLRSNTGYLCSIPIEQTESLYEVEPAPARPAA
eukprot:scaffold15685_cov41-Phaeocystis_antarctica.AAC.2